MRALHEDKAARKSRKLSTGLHAVSTSPLRIHLKKQRCASTVTTMMRAGSVWIRWLLSELAKERTHQSQKPAVLSIAVVTLEVSSSLELYGGMKSV